MLPKEIIYPGLKGWLFVFYKLIRAPKLRTEDI